jgi:ATP-dependent DNA helicase RecQ
MKDQVATLQKCNIKATALTGGIKSDEMIDPLDTPETINFYLSPERLQSDWIIE